MFENKFIKGIHVSRYIASWLNVGGSIRSLGFELWLERLLINGEHLTEDEIRYIRNFARNGKLELETNAKLFLNSVNK